MSVFTSDFLWEIIKEIREIRQKHRLFKKNCLESVVIILLDNLKLC